VVKHGAQQAGKDMGDTINYQGSGDPQTQSSLIDAAGGVHVTGGPLQTEVLAVLAGNGRDKS